VYVGHRYQIRNYTSTFDFVNCELWWSHDGFPHGEFRT